MGLAYSLKSKPDLLTLPRLAYFNKKDESEEWDN